MMVCEKRRRMADIDTEQDTTSAAAGLITAPRESRASGSSENPVSVEDELDPQLSFLAAIAQELTNIREGTLVQSLCGARRLLKEAFKAIKQTERPPYGVPDVASCSIRKPAELALAG